MESEKIFDKNPDLTWVEDLDNNVLAVRNYKEEVQE
jgi:hypothetical protein